MKDSISVKISTPFKNEFKGQAYYIELPTISGIIGVMPNHIPIISALKNGIIKIKTAEKTFDFEITDGFVRFYNNTCSVSIKDAKSIQKTAI